MLLILKNIHCLSEENIMADAMDSYPLSIRPEEAMHRCSGSIKQGACQDESLPSRMTSNFSSLTCP